MTALQALAWVAVPLASAVAAAWAAVPRRRPAVRALPAVVAMAFALAVVVSETEGGPPAASALVGLTATALGVLAGAPVTSAVLELAMRRDVVAGTHGGILVDARHGSETDPRDLRPTRTREVLRGGAAIGYLERFAIVGAALVGHLEIVAAVIAIKGLGRFTELDSAEARERFIVGTLTSCIWAGLAAAVAVQT